jgi:hypothetical protein
LLLFANEQLLRVLPRLLLSEVHAEVVEEVVVLVAAVVGEAVQ